MRVIIDEDGERIDTGLRCADDCPIEVIFCDGYAGCDVQVGHQVMTWKELDVLKEAIAKAERRWRK